MEYSVTYLFPGDAKMTVHLRWFLFGPEAGRNVGVPGVKNNLPTQREKSEIMWS